MSDNQNLVTPKSENIIKKLTFNRTLSQKGNIGVNPYHFINSTKPLAKLNLNKLMSGSSSPINTSFANLEKIED